MLSWCFINTNSWLVRLQVKVVIRTDVSGTTYDKVAVISGGRSGHEHAHAGYVGEGMLTAAICGYVFDSPSVDSVLAVAEAAATTGLSLADVASEAQRASEKVGTMGVVLSVCTLPSQVTSDRLGTGKIELVLMLRQTWCWCCCGRPSACGSGGFSCS
ncbi:hypothetical protein V6N11_067965 [Hibiscus sabdariffa]|uniref:DhaK domain-containing protein n=1 Tax=Hibiscus sabdariffa TaxID=183260 RepID=A0ABR2SSA7_9ROSI